MVKKELPSLNQPTKKNKKKSNQNLQDFDTVPKEFCTLFSDLQRFCVVCKVVG